jgi:predicted MFS family arabinose efflux permease
VTAPLRTSSWRIPVVLLGAATVGSYGLVLYGFGAFVAPMRDDTGWSNGSISAAFSISTLLGGLLALTTGRLLDRIGARPVMGSTLVVGAALLLLSSLAESAAVFVTAWGLGGAIISAGLFYNATMAITARVTSEVDRPSAYTWLTVIGGLASPIAFPLAGAFVEVWGWRGAVRAMVVFMIVTCLPAVVLVRGDEHGDHGGATSSTGFANVGDALRSGHVVRWLVAASAALAGLVAVQVHHVAAIEATGVGIGAASTMAGIRGFLSLPGRAAVSTLANRLGVVNALRLMYLVMAIGTLALALAGPVGWVWVFVVLTGITFGSVAPLQGLYAVDLYGRERIGTLMGMQQVVFGAASAAGPLLLGLTVDATGGYATLLVAVAVLQIAALFAFREPNVSGHPGQDAE